MRDHPVIAAIERTGYPRPYRQPVCPVCGEACETLFVSQFGDTLGCEHCVMKIDAWDMVDDENR